MDDMQIKRVCNTVEMLAKAITPPSAFCASEDEVDYATSLTEAVILVAKNLGRIADAIISHTEYLEERNEVE